MVDTQTTRWKKIKILCFNCDNKYSKGHKCTEKKLFCTDYEEEEQKEEVASQEDATWKEIEEYTSE